ncbi:hypothetical protein EJ03DRAFT_337832 [Teratosphaeria nubilosa]|uniref:Uncharacterized protein n=1 Tax=Teratosphaeria nubilosa TaxID=161662 RepID=A0A6G1L303_9PEZI|nr:hypothetical protein EJ03DRAFT_337832 [Teratosphaeria nubilosa]
MDDEGWTQVARRHNGTKRNDSFEPETKDRQTKDAINTYTACIALGFSLDLNMLERDICKQIQKKPIEADEFQTTIALLPLNHVFMEAAVQSLTFFRKGERMSQKQIRELGQILSSTDITKMFRIEHRGQGLCQRQSLIGMEMNEVRDDKSSVKRAVAQARAVMKGLF